MPVGRDFDSQSKSQPISIGLFHNIILYSRLIFAYTIVVVRVNRNQQQQNLLNGGQKRDTPARGNKNIITHNSKLSQDLSYHTDASAHTDASLLPEDSSK